MAFNGLPDSDRYPHPRLAWLIACGFDLVLHALYRREEMLPRGYRLQPGSLIVSNHLRDSDVPILTAVLCRRTGLQILHPLPFFATREDLFHRQGLAGVLADWPRPLARLLGAIPLGWFLRNVRCSPMRRLREFSWGETLQELCAAGLADADPAMVFNARGRRELVARLGPLPPRLAAISPAALGRLRFAPWGLRRLQLAAFRTLKPALRATIAAQLGRFAALLDDGHTVYFAPEGTISPSGEFGRIRSGVFRLCRLYRAADCAPLLPLALSYDALGPGRLRVIVQVGAPLHELDPSDPLRFAADLRRGILGLCAVNPSHLTARFLCAGPRQFSTDEFAGWLHRATAAVRAAGLTLDPLLERTAPDVLARQRLRWLARKKLVSRDGSQWRNQWPREAQPGWRTPAGAVRYLANSFADLSPALAQRLEP